MSRVLTVAREDLRHALRERLVWGAVVLLGLMFLPSTAAIAASGHRTIEEFLLQMSLDLITFVLVVAAAVGSTAVVGERASGRVRYLLGLPGTRRTLFLGKLLARVVVVTVALSLVLAVANVLVASGYGQAYLVPFWTMAGWMLLYGVVWTAVAVGYSAALSSQYRSLGALVMTYVTFSPDFGVWSAIVRPVFSFAFTGTLDNPTYERLGAAPLWLRATERLNPLTDFWLAMQWSVEAVGPGTPTGDPLPHLLGTVVFVLFGVTVLGIGLYRFEGVDLGDDVGGLPWGDRLWRVAARTGGRVAAIGSATGGSAGRTRAIVIAQDDARHALQSWVVVGAIGLFFVLVGPQLWAGIETSTATTKTEALVAIPRTVALPGLVLGIAVGYGAIAGERESGTARLVLGLPATRRDVVLGKLLARLSIAAVSVLPVVAFAEALILVRFDGIYPAAFIAWAGGVLVFVFAWTSAVVGLSAASASRYRALGAVAGTYLVFGTDVGLWEPVVRPLIALVFTGQASAGEFAHAADGGPPWFRYTDGLDPFVSLNTVQEGLFVATGQSTQFMQLTLPWFLYSLVVVVLFATVPVYLGYRRFDRSDLG